MPFVLIPLLWSKLSGFVQSKQTKQERSHGDGIFIEHNSPEALEEVFWQIKNQTNLKLRIFAKPDEPIAELIAHLGLQLTNAPKIFQNVVPKN